MKRVFEMYILDEGHDEMVTIGRTEAVAHALYETRHRVLNAGSQTIGLWQNVHDANGNIIGQWRLKM